MQEPNKKKVFDYSLLVRIYSYVKPYKHWFYFSLVLAILIAILAPIRPYLIQLTIDKATGKNIIIPTWLQFIFPSKNLNIAAQLVIWITIFQIVFIIFETIIRFVFSYLTAKLGQHIVKDLRVSVFKKILHLRLRQFDKTPIGTLTTRTINDIESINDIFSDGLIPIISDLLTIIFTVATMFWINWQLALIALIPFPFIIIATYYFKESVNASFIRVRNAVANLNAFVQEHLTGINIVQAFAAEEKEFKKFEAINQEHRSANIKAIFAYSVFFPVVELVLAVSIGLTVWFIAGKQLNPGLLIAFILYLNQIFKPLRIIADKFNVLQMGMIAAERVFKVLDNKDVEPTNNTSANILQLKGDITFNNVWFAYKPQQYVLKNISFNVQQGETVALIGHTGSGKTSIISILNKLYDIEKGEILIDDFNIDKINISTLRKNIAVVLQDVFLFAGTIKDNITLENKLITNEKYLFRRSS